MHKILKEINDAIKASSVAIRTLVGILIVIIIFWAGIAVGYHKAQFSNNWHSHYAEQFTSKQSPFSIPNDSDADNMPNPHGAFGQIISANLPLIIIKGPIEAEKTIVVTNTTVVRDVHDQVASTSLVAGQGVVVIGYPDEQGRVVASFIRILPK